jgi:hypothetical protein
MLAEALTKLQAEGRLTMAQLVFRSRLIVAPRILSLMDANILAAFVIKLTERHNAHLLAAIFRARDLGSRVFCPE